MDKKKAKKILTYCKILKYFLSIINAFLWLIILILFFYIKIPFFPFIFLWCLFVFGGHNIVLRVFFKKTFFLCSFNSRKCIIYTLIPETIACLIVCLVYWKWSVLIINILISTALKLLLN